jgi:hypothetical protein
MAAPELRAVGAVDAQTTTLEPGLPVGTETGDLLLMCIESDGTAMTAEGWTGVISKIHSGSSTRLTVLYRVAQASNPTKTSAAVDHAVGRIIGIKKGTFNTSAPIHKEASSEQAATKAGSMPSVTTTEAESLILGVICGALPDATGTAEFSEWKNANLEVPTERIDNTTNKGNGGAVGAFTGVKKVAGETGASTVVCVTESVRACATLAIAPFKATTYEGKGTIAASGTIAGAGVRGTEGKASVAGTGSLQAAGTREAVGKATVSGVSAVKGAGVREAVGVGAVSGAGTISAAGTVTEGGEKGEPQVLRPDEDLDATGWEEAPLWPKLSDQSGETRVKAPLS